jgi:hypothetical protein
LYFQTVLDKPIGEVAKKVSIPWKKGSPIHMTFDKLRGHSLEKRISNSHDI